MKLILMLTIFAAAFVVQQQQTTVEESELVVTKFRWSKYRQTSSLIRGVDNPPAMNEPVQIPRPERPNEPQELKNRRDMSQRRVEMVITEENARRSADKSRPDVYVLHLELKNAGENLVRSFVFEYRPTAVSDDYEARQYVCSMKAKPHESKTFEIFTPFAPVKVVSASGEKLNDKDGKLIINQIEFDNRPIWKRKGFGILVPPETAASLSPGHCLVF